MLGRLRKAGIMKTHEKSHSDFYILIHFHSATIEPRASVVFIHLIGLESFLSYALALNTKTKQ